MSRLSKWLRSKNVRLGPLVDWAVRLAEKVLGANTGELKKKLVAEIMAIIVKYLKEIGKNVPENAPELVDELTEQTVALLNETGTLAAISAEASEPVVAVRTSAPVSAPTSAPTKRRGRPPGSVNKPRADVKGVGPVKLPEPMFEADVDFGEVDLTGFDLDESDD